MKFSKDHCSYWDGIPQDSLTDYNRMHIHVLQQSFGRGVWNIPVNWGHVEWGLGNYVKFNVRSDMATHDSDVLTRLVLSAHENAVRVDVSPCNFRHLSVEMWVRDERDHRTWCIHPTIEFAVSCFRKSIK